MKINLLKICNVCGEEYRATGMGQKYCDNCNMRKCKCGKLFKVKDYHFKQKYCSPKCSKRYQIRKGNSSCFGKNHPNWKGGTTPLLLLIRRSFKYLKWREAVFMRDKFTCQKCSDNKGGNLEAHHIIRFSDIIREYKITNIKEANKCSELWNLDNGITYCDTCHIYIGTDVVAAKEWGIQTKQIKVYEAGNNFQ